jgi:hypothetical protein
MAFFPNGYTDARREEGSVSLQKIMIRSKSERSRAFSLIDRRQTEADEADEAAKPDGKDNPPSAK